MNCPYCDETINALAKFCPKCGLPLKDDATVMGAYVSDDGPNWMLIGGGAAAIAAIALAIGFLTSGNGKPTETVRKETVVRPGQAAAAPVFGTPMPTYGLNPNMGLQTMNVSAGRSMTNTKANWAYTPPANPPAPAPVWQPPQVADSPRHLVLTSPTIVRQAPVVQVAKSSEPAIPAIPPSEFALLTAPPQPTFVETTPEAALNAAITRTEAKGVWVYDPVQERWALRPEVRQRNLGTVRRAPSTDFVPAAPRAPLQPIENPGPIE